MVPSGQADRRTGGPLRLLVEQKGVEWGDSSMEAVDDYHRSRQPGGE